MWQGGHRIQSLSKFLRPLTEGNTLGRKCERQEPLPESRIVYLGYEKIRVFRNLLGWQRKSRVWPGQAAPQRRIFATYRTLGAKRLAQSEFRFFVPQLPLVWQNLCRKSMLIHVYPSKFRKTPFFSRNVHKFNVNEIFARDRFFLANSLIFQVI